MSWRATSWAAEQKTGSPISKLVLLKLADNANDEGICWPSLETIAAHTELSRRTVQDHLARLEAMGKIAIEERKAETGASLANRYRLLMAVEGAAAAPPMEGAGNAPRGAARAREDAQPRTGRVQIAASPIEEPSIEPSGNRHSLTPADADERQKVASLGAGQPERWPEFRSAVAKSWPDGFPADDEVACRKQFDRITRQNTVELLIACASLHGAALGDRRQKRGARGGTMFAKRPSNWLREGDWQGYIPQAEELARREADTVTAVGNVRRALGEGLFDLLRWLGMPDASIAFLDGVTLAGPASFTVTRPFQKTLLEKHGGALERHLGERPSFHLVAEAKAS